METNENLFQNLEYNVPGGKLNRGISVVDTVEILRGAPLESEEDYFEVALLGWGVELVRRVFFFFCDDRGSHNRALLAASFLPRF